MTLKQYIDYALAKKQIEYHSYGGVSTHFQCVDLVNDYIVKVWGLKAIIGTDAKDFPGKLTDGMEFVKNTIDYLPEPGEIAVFSGKVGGGVGHISVVIDKGKQIWFASLDQNWSKKQQITLETHNYTNVLGFIRKKGNMSELIQVEKKDWERARKSMDILKDVHSKLGLKEDHINIGTVPYMEAISQRDSRINNLSTDLKQCQSNPQKIKIEQEVNIAGIPMTVNGATIDSNGVVTANYRIK